MSTASTFFGGSGGGGIPNQRLFTSSGTFTCPVKGNYLVTAIGGGGASKFITAARGAGAGGLAQSLVKFNAGDVLTFTIGAGGTPVSGDTNQAGGTTTLTGTGISLTANGGNSATFGVGGTASGGNMMNIQGGSSGTSSGNGGGAVGVYGCTPNATSTFEGSGTGIGQHSLPSGQVASYSGGSTSHSFLNGRLLQPAGSIQGATSSFSPGVGGYAAGKGGMFAGGGGGEATPSSPGAGGQLGGGAGGAINAGGYNAAGGVGGVIIEFFIS